MKFFTFPRELTQLIPSEYGTFHLQNDSNVQDENDRRVHRIYYRHTQ